MYFLTNLSQRFIIILLFLAVLLLFISPVRFLGTDDSYPTRLIPISIIKEGNFDLNEFADIGDKSAPYYFKNVNGHIISKYPVLTGILAVPVYLLPVLAKNMISYQDTLVLAKITVA